MEKKIKIELTPKEIAETLFSMDETQVSEVFDEWHNVFKENQKRLKDENYKGFTHDLDGFLFYLIPKLSEKGKDIFRTGYAYLFKNKIDESAHNWLL